MNIDDMYPSKYLRAADLPRRGTTLMIDAIEQEKIGGDDKYVLYFVKDEERGLVLNKTNALTIADGYGKDTAEWSGRRIHLRTEKGPFQGGRVDALRVSIVEFDDDIPMNDDAA